ncbi:MAG: hypothetical protein GY951_01475, partial [Psychromonas sp.]|nr:hypothetical protein [Psychromonas sp.]
MLFNTIFILFISLLVACKPSADSGKQDQFYQKNKQLFFMDHKLVHWLDKRIPECQTCSFNIYSKKMLPGAMLFKQINDERGDLVFLSATNIRYSFALQTGGRSYSIAVDIEGEKVQFAVEGLQPFIASVNDNQRIRLGFTNYFVKVKKINSK